MAQEKKWKDGDILSYKTFNSVWVVIFRDYGLFEGHIRYHALAELDFPENGLHVSGTCFMADDEEHMRLASEDEQNELFERLKKHGYRWDDEKKTLITIEPNEEKLKVTNPNIVKNTIWTKVQSMLNVIEMFEKQQTSWQECEKHLKNINDNIHDILENGLTNNLR